MGASKKKHAGKKAALAADTGNGGNHGADSFGAFVDAATAKLNQAALRPGNQSADLIIFDSEAMYAEVAELKLESYAVMKKEEAKHAAALQDFNQALPNKADLGKYLQHMRQMLQQQHEYIAQVAMHLQVGQRIEYEALTRRINKAFAAYNEVLKGVFSLCKTVPGAEKKEVKLMLHGMEADMRQLRQELEKQMAHQEDLRVKLLEFELLMKWQSLRDQQDPGHASHLSSSRPASAASSRGASPSPLERKALLKLEAQICASMGDYQGMIKRAQQLSATNKKLLCTT